MTEPTYTYTIIGPSYWTIAWGINDLGQIVGTSGGGPYLYENGSFQFLDFIGTPYDINDAGQIVGSSPSGGFIYSDGIFVSLVIEGHSVDALSINSSGQVAGTFYDEQGEHGFIYSDDGSYTVLNVPGQVGTAVLGINDLGDVVGRCFDAAGTHGFVYGGGAYTLIDHPLGYETFLRSINDAGDIVGWYYSLDTAGGYGFLYRDGTFTPISVPGSLSNSTIAYDINNLAEVVGETVVLGQNISHAFIARPTAPVNRYPTVSAPIIIEVSEDGTPFSIDLLQFATDPDALDVLHVANVHGLSGGVSLLDDRLVVDPNAYSSLAEGQDVQINVSYDIADGRGGSIGTSAIVTIHGANDAPLAFLDAVSVQKGGIILVDASHGLLSNDIDPDTLDSRYIVAVNGLSENVEAAIKGKYGTLIVHADGSYGYSAIAGVSSFGGIDNFTYTMTDGHGGLASATLIVAVQPQSAVKGSTISIAALNADRSEGNADVTSFTFLVSRAGDITKTTKVDWSVGANQSPAANGLDFATGAFPAGSVIFDAGDRSKIVTVDVRGDTSFESGGIPENFSIFLSNPSGGATIDPLGAFALAHIHNDDPAATKISGGFRHPLGSGYLTEDSSTSYLGHDEGSYLTKFGSGHGFYVEFDFDKFNVDINKPVGSYHLGEDWNGSGGGYTDKGVTVNSISNGQVIVVSENKGLGEFVVIEHVLPAAQVINGEERTSVYSLYAHLDSISVTVDQIVAIGEYIGALGDTGVAKGAPHLHFELRLVDPRLGAQYQDYDGYNPNGAPAAWMDPTDFINAFRSLPSPGSIFDF